jgi:fatty acid desaturase
VRRVRRAEWLGKHPGGPEQLLLAAGRDVTELLPSYHPFSGEKPAKMLKAYLIGTCVDSEFPQFEPDASGFYRTLRERVGAYFAETSQDPKDQTGMVLRMVPTLVGFVASYWAMFHASEWWVRVAAAVSFGLFQGFPLLHAMHDACHCAVGHTQTLWQLWGRLPMDVMAGGSIFSWQHQHVVGHHVYTNVYMADPDLPHVDGDPRYIVSRQVWTWLYRFQHIYMPVLYALLALKMRFDDVAYVWLQGKDGPIRVNWFESPLVRVVLTKGLWFAWRVVLPLVLFRTPLAELLLLFFVSEFTTGWWLAFNFQVSHISDGADFPNGVDGAHDRDTLPREWAKLQAESSVNWKGGLIADFLCGALNYQIEHHLFPSVSQYHYPAIAPIVQKTCKEFGVRYVSYDGYLPALSAHLMHLYKLGQQGKPAPLHLD